ncbi:glutaredoxin-like protein [Desulfosporosinus orientis DSM 765]|uniref:Glutaredoxin-like protein n=1 Tax=Desulfosporosinus orientis (strain ATCC 19365 / DSM 765 / NCIMB 8382 / VKM B-1628 / Singapore I) TaxID=768706 RepID=G7W5C7_DESOD|nr:glutaredoxin family protein [Desulfosporosinus orientis]AET66355.1 glutaredoxin-like protein [Desulfosporosinus orientis DSM 765]
MSLEVTMYTLPLCPYCARARRFLTDKGILFTEKNIMFPKNLMELRSITNSIGVPITVAGDKILTRFSREEYEEVFKN